MRKAIGRGVQAMFLAAMGFTLGLNALAQSAARTLVPAEDFARRPKLSGMQFSPDGTKFAALEDFQGRRNLTVADVQSGKLTRVTQFERFDVAAFLWLSNSRLWLETTDFRKGAGEGVKGAATYAINADGSQGTQTLFDRDENPRHFFLLRQRVKGSDTDVLALSNQRGIDSLDLVRLNTVTMKWTTVSTDNPGYMQGYAVDKDLVLRAAMSRSADRTQAIFRYKDTATSPWREIARFPTFGKKFEPYDFLDDGTLLVVSNIDEDRQAIYKFDPKTGKPGEKYLAHPLVDITETGPADGGLDPRSRPLIIDPKSGDLIGVRVYSDKPETFWFDAKRAQLQKTMDVSLPAENVNSIRPLTDTLAVVTTYSSRDPGATYLFDASKGQLKEVYRPRPWIKPEQMSETKPIRYAARDGLSIPAYLTLPTGKEAKKLPLIAWIHGGPQARDHWGWEREAQFFANRGYAVLQPNYRGSTGYGFAHQARGYKQWGQAMQDDITDGIKKLIADGVVDASRVCIGGGSYGGYATMAGLVKEPEMFKCGINVVGVTDLVWMHDIGYSDFQTFDPKGSDLFLDTAMGSLSNDRAMLEANSPRRHAERIKAPVLFVHGTNDQRVPIKHAEGMRDAMKAAGKPYEWLEFAEEGHGWRKEENWVTYLKAMEKFLAKHIGN